MIGLHVFEMKDIYVKMFSEMLGTIEVGLLVFFRTDLSLLG